MTLSRKRSSPMSGIATRNCPLRDIIGPVSIVPNLLHIAVAAICRSRSADPDVPLVLTACAVSGSVMLRLLPILIVTLAASPALAGATAWQDIAPGVRARLISADTVTGGTTRAGLELDLPAGTHTYWRIPGETGIPAEFDFAGSTGLGAPVIDWPYPEIDHTGGYLGYIYT